MFAARSTQHAARAIACALVALALGSLMPACGNESEQPSAPVASVSQPIVNGVTDVDAPINNATFHVQTSSGFCSGSLLTSTVGLTAVHCKVSAGDVLSFGLNNPSGPAPTLPSRTRRVVSSVADHTPASLFGGESTSLSLRARDVALVFFSPPVTMDASPVKPTFQRPTLQELPIIGNIAVFAGGAAGYGDIALVADGGLSVFPPPQRQLFQSQNLLVRHINTGNGFAIWAYQFKREVLSGEPHGAQGDSGGPLFQVHPHHSSARDVLGVSSGARWEDCPAPVPSELCQLVGVDDEHAVSIYADITSPGIKSWIEAQLDRNGDGRWEGQVDYLRESFGTPGCDVASFPGCDPGCNAASDPDCDLVLSQNDNCALDYNPDQENSDDPNDPWDRTSVGDPGDVCDLCPYVPFAQDMNDNCNEDAERLAYGIRPRVRENHAIGPNPLNNQLDPRIEQNRQRYRGDACDPTPCTELAQREITLDPAKYGAPSPINIQCLLGSDCAWTAPALIERHTQIEPVQSGGVGQTGYRFCQCDPPFNDQDTRFNSCFAANPCPADPFVFATATRLKELTVNPPFVPISFQGTAETGTLDTFTYQAPSPRPGFDWLFENDQLAIMGQQNPSLPLTETSQVAIDGLVHSNVRSHSQFVLTPGARDLASYWMPMQLRFRLTSGSIFFVKDVVKLPGWWMDGCKNDPNCRFGFSVPLYVYPYANPSLLGVTPSHQSDLTDRISPAALSLVGTPGATVIPAAEHGGLLALRGARSAPRVAVVDLHTRAFVGALAQLPDGGFSVFRRRDDDGDIGGGPLAASASVGTAVGSSGASAASLSALHGKVFVLAREASQPKARLHVYDLEARTWTETPLTGVHVPEEPLALTYLAQHDALFAIGRKKGPGLGVHHLYRIGLDGAVKRLGITGVGLFKPEVYLTPTEDGALLLAVSRVKPARHRIAKLSISTHGAHAAGRLHGKGTLAAPPFLTRRALTMGLVRSDDTLEMRELPVSALAPPHGGPLLWALQ